MDNLCVTVMVEKRMIKCIKHKNYYSGQYENIIGHITIVIRHKNDSNADIYCRFERR